MNKSYLSQQIRLMQLTTTDLFTDEQYDVYYSIIQTLNEINKLKKSKTKQYDDPTIINQLISEKKNYQNMLSDMIKSHIGTPRTVRIRSVIDKSKCEVNDNDEYVYPKGISWDKLKSQRMVAQFMSAASRAMGLKHKDVTFDKVIIEWKSLDLLKQIIYDGFYLPVEENGTVINKKMMFLTSSAGQLRRDKIQCISQQMWERIKSKLMCGLTFDSINARGGINTSKLMAYMALSTSATEQWQNFDIDRTIVIDDFQAPVTGLMKFINQDYSTQVGPRTVIINHCDGSGIMLPCVNNGSYTNYMVRMPFVKGLLSTFDYMQFCRVNHCKPIIKDIYGVQHDLVAQDIQIIFTKSQFKLYKYFDSWEHYKKCFKQNGCTANRTNYEQNYIPDTAINYQMLQTLVDMTDEQIQEFTFREHERIQNLSSCKQNMLKALGAYDNDDPYSKSLLIYNSLLRDGYSRLSLKDIKKKMILDAKSGAIKCKNKRLFALPDFYAACQYWFLHNETPNGLLCGDQVAASLYRNKGVSVNTKDLIDANMNPGRCIDSQIQIVDVLRSPHLSCEHMLCPIVNDQQVYKWFRTNGIYTSVHSLITRRLQLDKPKYVQYKHGELINIRCL